MKESKMKRWKRFLAIILSFCMVWNSGAMTALGQELGYSAEQTEQNKNDSTDVQNEKQKQSEVMAATELSDNNMNSEESDSVVSLDPAQTEKNSETEAVQSQEVTEQQSEADRTVFTEPQSGDRDSEYESESEMQSDSQMQKTREPVVYWSPTELTDKNGTVIPKGKDDQSGQNTEEAVETFQKALETAALLKEELNETVTIYAMGTEKITQDSSKIYDGQGAAVSLWSERKSDDCQIFCIESGSLTLRNITLSGSEGKNLMDVQGGALHLGKDVKIKQDIQINVSEALKKDAEPAIYLEDDFNVGEAYRLKINAEEKVKDLPLITVSTDNELTPEELSGRFELNENQSKQYTLGWKDSQLYLNTVAAKTSVRKAARASSVVVYWNPTKTDHIQTDGSIDIHAGDDVNDGSRSDIPVLTWQRALTLAGQDGTIIYMTNVSLGSQDAMDAGIGQDDLTIDGGGVTLKQWPAMPEEAFLISEGKKLTLKNINIQADDTHINDSIIRIIKGELWIDENVTVSGLIQTELSLFKMQAAPIHITSALGANTKYTVYFSDINENQYNNCVNAAIPVPSEEGLLDHLILSDRNTSTGWSLRYQVGEGQDPDEEPAEQKSDHNIVEIYRQYQYLGIYLDGVSGDDNNFGGNCSFPVKTFDQAKKLLKENLNGKGTIYICDTVTITGDETWELEPADFSADCKVVSCSRINKQGWGHTTLVQNMVQINDGASFTMKNLKMVFENHVESSAINNYSAVNISPGGSFAMGENTWLNGKEGVIYTNGYGIHGEGTAKKRVTITIDGGEINGRIYGMYLKYADLNMKSGAISGHKYSGIYSDNSVIQIDGGTFEENGITSNSSTFGAMRVALNSTLNISGGIFRKNISDYRGGAVTVDSNSTANISGGTFSDNISEFSKSLAGDSNKDTDYSGGGAIWIGENSILNFNGDAEVSQNEGQNGGGISGYYPTSILNIGGNSVIKNNSAYFNGGGVFSGGTLNITGGTITENVTKKKLTMTPLSKTVGGGGIYMKNAKVTISGGIISSNTGYMGGGILAKESNLITTGGRVEGNTSETSGGGIQIYSEGTSCVAAISANITDTELSGMKILNNKAAQEGGGISYKGYIPGNTKLVNEVLQERMLNLKVQSTEISGNTSGDNGGGIHISAGSLSVDNTSVISNNTAGINGGGIYITDYVLYEKLEPAYEMIRTSINKNKAKNGAGIYVEKGNIKLEKDTFDANEASVQGGAVNLQKGSVSFTETNVSNNTAAFAGSLYLKGDTKFLSGSVTGGISSGDENKEPVYLNIPIDNNEKVYLDPAKVTIEDGVFMNTATSKFWLLDEIKDPDYHITVSINADKFLSGSVIVAPVGTIELNGTSYTLSDASGYASNFDGGTLPEKSILGGFNKSVIVIGEGIYLSGDGNDANSGMGPVNALKTFDEAKKILYDKIKKAKESNTEFTPHIYICGEINVGASATWELTMPAADSKGAVLGDEIKIVRFASYYGQLISVNQGTLTLQNITIDGQKLAVDGVNNPISPMVAVGKDAELIVTDGANVTSDYSGNIGVNGGKVTITGEGTGGRVSYPHTNGVYAYGGATVILEKNGHVDSDGENFYYDNTKWVKSGIRIAGEGTVFLMKDSSKIFNIMNGVYVGGGTARITENSLIAGAEEGIRSVGGKTLVYDNAVIRGCSMGVRGMSNGDTDIYGSAKIESSDSKLTGYFGEDKSKFHLYENATLQNLQSGIYLSKGSPTALADGESIIKNSNYGIRVQTDQGDAASAEVSGDAKIYNCMSGIYIKPYDESSTGITSILLKGNAQIDGQQSETQTNEYGIEDLNGAASIKMQEQAKISNYTKGGILIHTLLSGDESCQVAMSGNASITDNGGNGITLVNEEIKFTPVYPIILSDSATISQNKGRGIQSDLNSEIVLGEGTVVKENCQGTEETAGSGIYTSGGLKLDGKALIEDEIYMNMPATPITLTSSVEKDKQFKLGYSSNFRGTIIVKPDMKGVTDASLFYDNFTTASHVPDDSSLLSRTPNIEVSAGRNVYIAGDATKEGTAAGIAPGDDKNNGLSVVAPVRTFKKAIEILKQSEGNGNIYICNYPVEVLKGDENWSFDENGEVSNGKISWKPSIIREENFKGNMIQLTNNNAATRIMELNLKGLKIDGNKEKAGLATGTVVYVGTNQTVIKLKIDDVTIQNQYSNYSATMSPSSTFGLYGGVIDVRSGAVELTNSVITKNEMLNGTSVVNIASNTSQCVIENTKIDDNKIVVSNHIFYGTLSVTGMSQIKDSSISGNKIYHKGTTGLQMYGLSLYVTGNDYTLNMEDTVIDDNTVEADTAGKGFYYGAVCVNAIKEVNIKGGSVSNNTGKGLSYAYGAGVYISSSKGTIEDSKISGNGSENVNYSYGGALYVTTLYALNLKNTELVGNSAMTGGGIYVSQGTVNITGGKINQNIASGKSTSQGLGGAIYLDSNDNKKAVNMDSCTLDNNSALNLGGGIYLGKSGEFWMRSGSIQGNRAGKSGSAIYYLGATGDTSSKVEIESGRISGNITGDGSQAASGVNAGIYVAGPNFCIKGGESNITDRIYLNSESSPITLTGGIYQKGRIYNVDLGDNFKKGSVIVKPDKDVVTNATQYYIYFEAKKTGLILEKESPNLVLKQCVFIDSVNGSDNNDGSTPKKAVATFDRAKAVSENKNAIIYVSGEVHPGKNETWDLDPSCSMIRYTGFMVDGVKYDAFNGDMIVLKDGSSLTTGNISIYGRREIDDVKETKSIIKAETGSSFTMQADTVLGRNKADIGGAININGGEVFIKGGKIEDTESSIGSAVYQNGLLNMSGTSNITGSVFLEGSSSEDKDSRYITSSEDYTPVKGSTLTVAMRNPYNHRHVVRYPENYVPTLEVKEQYTLSTDVLAVYRFENRSAPADNILELQQKGVVYIDGSGPYGDDAHDGTTPMDSVKTLERAYLLLKDTDAGGLIIVVGTVPITDKIFLVNKKLSDNSWEGSYQSGSVKIDTSLPVLFRRYSQPTEYDKLDNHERFEVNSFTGTLFEVQDKGEFSFTGITIDGHSNKMEGNLQFAAPAVEAAAALLTVSTGGKLEADNDSVFTSNNNVSQGGTGGALLVNGGQATLRGTGLKDVKAEKGSAVYQNGKLTLSRQPVIEGDIYLTGAGQKGDTTTSKYIDIELIGFRPQGGELSIRMDDPYDGRPVALYPSGTSNSVYSSDIGIYNTEKEVRELYTINKRNSEPDMLELQLKPAVYIDGVDGSDKNNGETPDTSVKTLKRAYELLKGIRGGALYVVNTVTVTEKIILTNMQYEGNADIVTVEGNQSEIRRYVKPDIAVSAAVAGYNHATNENLLFQVAENGSLTVTDLVIDGHKNPRTGDALRDVVVVSGPTQAKAALIGVEKSGALHLGEGAVLTNNNNTSTDEHYGGAIYNKGTVYFDNALISQNEAGRGAGVYQHGTFTFESGIKGIEGQGIYLAAENMGTQDAPVWNDYYLTFMDKIPDNMKLNVDMDHAVRTRNVAIFDNTAAYDDIVANEIEHFELGSTVPVKLPLIKSRDTSEVDTLELHDYRDVKVKAVWEDHNNLDSTRPATNINISVKGEGSVAGIVPVNALSSWSGTCTYVNQYVDPQYVDEIAYSIDAPAVEKYTQIYSYDSVTDTYIVTYTYAPKRTVTYDPNGGSGFAPADINSPYDYEAEVTVLGNTGDGTTDSELKKDGYQFAGWNTLANGKGTNYLPGDQFDIKTDVTLYASWMKAEKSSKQETQDGFLKPGEVITYTITVTAPWDTDKIHIEDSIPEGTEYVQNSINPGTGSFDGTKIQWDSLKVTSGQTLTYSFKVRVLENTTANTDIKNQASVMQGKNEPYVTIGKTNVVTDIVSQTYRLTYDKNQADTGIVPEDSSYYGSGQKALVQDNNGNGDPQQVLKKTNASFAGWNTKSDGSGTHYNNGDEVTMTSDTTLYAMWLKAEKSSDEKVKDSVLKPNEQLDYTIEITPPEDISSMTVVDKIPTNTTYVADTANESGIYTSSITDPGTLTWNLKNLKANEKIILTFSVRVNENLPENTPVDNQADITIGANEYHTNTVNDKVGKTYRVTYHKNNSEGTLPVDDNYYRTDETVTVKGNAGGLTPGSELKRDGFRFTGWNTSSDGKGTHYDEAQTFKITSDTDLYAMWMETGKAVTEEEPSDILKPNEKLFYTIRITPPEDTSNLIVTDVLSEEVEYVVDSSNIPAAYDKNNHSLVWTIKTAAANVPIDITFAVQVKSNIQQGQEIKNTAQAEFKNKIYTTNETKNEVGQTWRVTYDGNQNETGVPPTDSNFYTDGKSVTVLGNIGNTLDPSQGPMTVTNGHFIGWNTDKNGLGTTYLPDAAFNITSDTTLYAMWLKAEKTSDEEDKTDILKPGEEITYKIAVTVPRNAEEFKVTDVIPSGTAYVADSAGPKTNVEYKDGKLTWSFTKVTAGTKYDLSFKVTVDKDTAVNTDILNKAALQLDTLTFTSNETKDTVGDTYRLTYDANGADAGDVPVDAVFYTAGKSATVKQNDGNGTPANVLTKNNGGFMGWNTAGDGSGIHYAPGDPVEMNSDVTLYAMWSTASKSSQDLSGDSTVKPGTTLIYKITVTVPEDMDTVTVTDTIPQHTTYVTDSATLGGIAKDNAITWTLTDLKARTPIEIEFKVQTDNHLSQGTKIENQAVVSAKNVTIITNKVEDPIGEYYKVTYDGNGGTGTVPQDNKFYNPNADVTVKGNHGNGTAGTELTKQGAVFIGWNTETDGTGKTYKAEDTFRITADTTLHAMWLGAVKTSKEEHPENILKPGEKLTYTIELLIPQSVDSMTVTDKIPDNTSYVAQSADGSNGVYDSTTKTITWTLTKLTAGEKKTLSFSVMADRTLQAGTSVENTADIQIGANTYHTTTANDTIGTTYKVTYDGNGNTTGTPPTDRNFYASGEEVTVLGNIGNETRSATGAMGIENGYFAGWNTQSDGTGKTYLQDGTFIITGDTTLYAMWIKVEKSSKEEIQDGTLRPSERLTYTVEATIPENQKEVHIVDTIPANTEFVTGSAGAGVYENGKITWIFKDVQAGQKLTVSFDVTVKDNLAADTQIQNKAVVEIGNNQYDSNVINDKVGKTYQLTYDKNGADSGQVPIDTKHYIGTEKAVVVGNNGNGQAADIMKKSGAQFAGWNTAADGTGTGYLAGEQVPMTGDVTLYAMWLKAEKGSEQEVADNAVRPGEILNYKVKVTVPEDAKKVTVTDRIPAGTSYVFGSASAPGKLAEDILTWEFSDVAAGTVIELSFQAKVNTTLSPGTSIVNMADVDMDSQTFKTNTIVDKVADYLTVTYDKNGGKGIVPADPNSYIKNEEVSVKGNVGDGTPGSQLTNTGKQFAGWNTKEDGSGITYQTGNIFKITESTVLYAMWLEADKTSQEAAADNVLRPGEILTYTITVILPYDQSTVTITDNIPEGTMYVQGSAGSGIYDNDIVTWTISNVKKDVPVNVTFQVKVKEDTSAGTQILNNAGVQIGPNSYTTTTTRDEVGETHQITYDANGADSGNVPVDLTHYTPSESAVIKTNDGNGNTTDILKKDGEQFAGWNTKADGTGDNYNSGEDVVMTDDVKLYAMWLKAEKTSEQEVDDQALKPEEELTYHIKVTVPKAAQEITITDKIPQGTAYMADSADNGGTYGEGKVTWVIQNVQAGDVIELSFKVKVDELLPSGTTINNKAEIQIGNDKFETNVVTDTVVQYFKVSYNANGGNGILPNDNNYYLENEEVIVQKNIGDGTAGSELVKPGMQFIGWNTKADGSGTPYQEADVFEITESTVLYAMWLGADKVSAEEKQDGALRPGEILEYMITVTLPSDQPEITITDEIPAGTLYVEGSAGEGIYDNGKLTWTIHDVKRDTPVKVSFKVQVKEDIQAYTTITNQAVIVIGQNKYQTTTTTDTVAETYQITYDPNQADSGKVPVDSTRYTPAETTLVRGNDGNGDAESILKKDGAQFAGWNTEADGSGIHFNSGEGVSMIEDVTLYAMWLKADKTSSEAAKDNVLRPGEEITYHISVTVPFDQSGVTITDTIPQGTVYVDGSAESSKGTSSYKDGVITWSFDDVKGKDVLDASFRVKVKEDTAANTLVTNQAGVLLGANTYQTNQTNDLVDETHRITYDANHADSGKVPVDENYYSTTEEATVRSNDGNGDVQKLLKKDGAQFAGWNTKADGTGTGYQADESVPMTEDVTLYAMWLKADKTSEEKEKDGTLRPGEVITYNISVMVPADAASVTITDRVPDGTMYVQGSAGNGVYDNDAITWTFENVKSGDTLNASFMVKVKDSTPEGKDIINEASVQIGENTYQTATTTDTVGETHQITYDANQADSGNVPVDGKHYTPAESAAVKGNDGNGNDENILKKDGSQFAGWNTAADGSGVTYNSGTSVPMTKDVTLYAMWLKADKTSTEAAQDNVLRPGEEITYHISVTVPFSQKGVTITDKIPAGTTFVEGSLVNGSGTGSNTDGVITWNFTNVASGTVLEVSFRVKVKEGTAEGTLIKNQADVQIGENTYQTTETKDTVGETHQITYDANGANSGNVPIDLKNYVPAEQAAVKGNDGNGITANILKKDGAQFAGWNTKADGTGTTCLEGKQIQMTEDVTLYAMWLKADKTSAEENKEDNILRPGELLTYHISVTMPFDQDKVIITDVIPINTSYVENSAQSTAGIPEYKNGTLIWTFENVKSGVTLDASFKVKVDNDADANMQITNQAAVQIGENSYQTTTANDVVGNTYQVLYDANGADRGVVPVDFTHYIPNEKAAVRGNDGDGDPDNVLMKNGKQFAGWNTMADGTGTTYLKDEEVEMKAENVTLYAMWLKAEKSSAEENKDGVLRPGEILTYNITVTMPFAKDSVIITDKIPSGTTYVEDSAGNGVFNNGELTWIFENVQSGAELTVSFNVRVKEDSSAGTPITNQADVKIGENIYHTTTTNDEIAETYQITYDKNKADSGKVPIDSIHYSPSEEAAVRDNDGNRDTANILIKSGEQFVGWNTSADGTGTTYLKDNKVQMTKNVTLYAMWLKADKTSVEEEADGSLRPEENLTYHITVTVPDNQLEVTITDKIPSGTSFVEGSAGNGTYSSNVLTWKFNDVKAGTKLHVSFQVKVNKDTAAGTQINNQAQVKLGENQYQTTMTQDEAAETYQLTYDANGADSGVVPVDHKHYISGESAAVKGNDGNSDASSILIKDGEQFAGWNTEKDGTGESYNSGENVPMTADKVLYAMWLKAEKTSEEEVKDEALRPGEILTYHIKVTVPNNTDELTIKDKIPEGTTYVTDSANEGGKFENGELSWTVNGVKAGQVIERSFQVTINKSLKSGTEINNKAEAAVIGSNVFYTNEVKDSVCEYFTVKYDANGGSGILPADHNYYVSDETVSVLGNNGDGTTGSEVVNPGKYFMGWNTKADGSGTTYQEADVFKITKSETLYAMWLKTEKTSAKDSKDGILRPGDQITYAIKVTVPIQADKVTVTDVIPKGTTYVKDSMNPDGTYKSGKLTWNLTNVKAGEVQKLTFKVTVDKGTAIGTKITNQAEVTIGDHSYVTNTVKDSVGAYYTVQYDANGGTGNVPTDDIAYRMNEQAVVKGSGSRLTRTGYTFMGWNTKKDGTGTTYKPGSRLNISGNMTLYAVWQKNSTPTPTPTPTPSNPAITPTPVRPVSPTDTTKTSAKTGDDNLDLNWYLLIMAISVSILGTLGIRRRKKEQKQ